MFFLGSIVKAFCVFKPSDGQFVQMSHATAASIGALSETVKYEFFVTTGCPDLNLRGGYF